MSYRYYGPADHKLSIAEVLGHSQQIAIDVETVSLKDRTPIGLSVAASSGQALYFPLWPEGDNPDVPWELINDGSIQRIYHNAMFDLTVLADYEPNPHSIIDTLDMAHLLSLPGELHELVWYTAADHAYKYPVEPAKAMLAAHQASSMLDLDQDEVAIKCCKDAMATLAVYEGMKDKVDQSYLATEMELVPILVKMSQRGIAVDEEVRQALEEELEDEMLYYRGLAEAEGFNPGSPKQVGYILAKRGSWLPFTRGHKALQTDVRVLEKLSDPMAALVLQYRHYQKMLGTYVRPLQGQARAYTRFHLDAATGRISSTERNLQNVPPLVRPMFVPDNGIFTDADFSQIELRILAYLSGDREMRYIFESGGSIHEATAEFMNVPYKLAKNTGFAMIYGATVESMMDTAKISDKSLAQRFMEQWGKKYRQAWDWIQFQQEYGVVHGTCQTILGRVFKLPVDEEDEGHIRRKSVNYPIQGSAAEIFKRALIRCKDMELANQVHDEIIVDGPATMPDGIEWIIPDLHTPVKVRVMERWE